MVSNFSGSAKLDVFSEPFDLVSCRLSLDKNGSQLTVRGKRREGGDVDIALLVAEKVKNRPSGFRSDLLENFESFHGGRKGRG